LIGFPKDWCSKLKSNDHWRPEIRPRAAHVYGWQPHVQMGNDCLQVSLFMLIGLLLEFIILAYLWLAKNSTSLVIRFSGSCLEGPILLVVLLVPIYSHYIVILLLLVFGS
jgi:hypothetical protein